MKSKTMQYPFAQLWAKSAEPEAVALVDEIYAAAEEHYNQGGDQIVECFTPDEVLSTFRSVEEAKEHCNILTDRAKDQRWGEDSDPQLRMEHWE